MLIRVLANLLAVVTVLCKHDLADLLVLLFESSRVEHLVV